MNLRSRLTGIATGDQALFIRQDLFDAIGGFPEIPLRTSLHGQHGPRTKTQGFVEESRRFHHLGIVIGGERGDDGQGNSSATGR